MKRRSFLAGLLAVFGMPRSKPPLTGWTQAPRPEEIIRMPVGVYAGADTILTRYDGRVWQTAHVIGPVTYRRLSGLS